MSFHALASEGDGDDDGDEDLLRHDREPYAQAATTR